ncbi:hypothetical protein ACVXG7_09225 [Enterobacter hormaechei]
MENTPSGMQLQGYFLAHRFAVTHQAERPLRFRLLFRTGRCSSETLIGEGTISNARRSAMTSSPITMLLAQSVEAG